MKKKLNSFLKYALFSHSKKTDSNQGFVIPLVIGFGLFMILVALTMINRSGDDRVNSQIQKSTSQAIGAAEVGVARYKFLINRARVIATYKDCVSTRNADGTCPDTTQASWANATKIPGIDVSACSGTPPSTEVISLASTTAWQNISDTDLTKGQFRLVSYTYTPNTGLGANEAPGTGILTVEGRSNQQGSGTTATNGINTGITRLQVKIPVQKNTLTGTVAGLWMSTGTTSINMGNDKVNGNIVVKGCTMPGTGDNPDTSNLANPTTQQVEVSPKAMPTPPSLPSSSVLITGVDPIGLAEGLPRQTDIDATPSKLYKGYYHYLVKNLVWNGNESILIKPGYKVILYVQGNIDLGGNPDINPTSVATNLQIYGNSYPRDSSGNPVTTSTLYGCGCTNPSGCVTPSATYPFSGTTYALTLGSTCPTLTAHFNGTGTMRAIVQAIDATGSVSGGGNTEGNFKGTLWLKTWDSVGGNSKVKIDAEGALGDVLAAEGIIVNPSIKGDSNWERQEVNN